MALRSGKASVVETGAARRLFNSLENSPVFPPFNFLLAFLFFPDRNLCFGRKADSHVVRLKVANSTSCALPFVAKSTGAKKEAMDPMDPIFFMPDAVYC